MTPCRSLYFGKRHGSNVGAGLLAKRPCQPTCLLNDPPLSRASPLPPGSAENHDQCFSSRTLFSSAPSILNVAVLSIPSRYAWAICS
ncbi:hypothetical protein C3E97_028535 [Pseudomonas sp. MWU12-2115]|nr:hypothetical protein C3E97_028535 [Pseudomonas sp. MWU12-2115]